ncbi:ABC transporter ATP-binding protein [Agrobacterium vitis]|uniref:ABC transporter ATP-binding protein n=1 Tax=Agrobacterium vitis TaxID=373 RepID=UPI001573775A|nr:ABC transporter ATP-binding protein [Agrobacterium vitis]NSZ19931.1 ABC transporter ATP-binding protein [Agrobacterium vitis]QZO07633.1 ABC transporter ATP-binding protein [Agrobacterium vitis]UJL90829.1 ABC transporter ATP-binding protein [Agrobacterium vitis]
MSEAAKLQLNGISSGYGAVDVINDVSLAIKQGEIFALMGKNGMGKTTLLKSILGFMPLSKGSVNVDGKAIAGKRPAELVASGIGYAPQEQPLFQDLSIRDNLRLALRSDRELSPALKRVYSYFPFLEERLVQKAGTLSGGEQKMLILARALMLRPKLLLIDEISEGLQPSVIIHIASALKHDRARNGTTILLVEQNLDFALSVADRWAVLKLGAINDEDNNGPDTRARVLQHLKI